MCVCVCACVSHTILYLLLLLLLQSRKFLRGEEVMRGLVSDPGPVLDDVRLVIWTLQALKEAYSQCRTQLENQQQVSGVCVYVSRCESEVVRPDLRYLQLDQRLFTSSQF